MSPLIARVLIVASTLVIASTAAAQSLGTFRWQLEPFCNVLVVNVTQQPSGTFALNGIDDLCGATSAAGLFGAAFLHPTGTVGFGLDIVLPDATPVHVEATFDIRSLAGSWHDSAGNSGTLRLRDGPVTSGVPRPVPAGGIALHSITSEHLAPESIGAAQLAPNSVTGNHVIDGSLTTADLAPTGVLPGAILPNSVSSAQVIDGSLTGADIAANSLTGEHIVNGSLTQAHFRDAPRLLAAGGGSIILKDGDTATVMARVTLVAPAAGQVLINASGVFTVTLDSGGPHWVRCSVATEPVTVTQPWAELLSGPSDSSRPFALARSYSVLAGSSTTFALVCALSGTWRVAVHETRLAALYVPEP